jgi:pyruvate formate lyase activating enzyme
MIKVNVGNIQRFSVNDGPGIRTTVFLKGCTIHCPWCANPENINYQSQWAFDKVKCIKNKNSCIFDDKCPILYGKEIIGKTCESKTYENCLAKALYLQGKYMSNEDIEKEILKDLLYYRNGGGVTFSGGEPLFQISDYQELLTKLKKQDINTAVETALFVDDTQLEIALKYIDLFIVDIKILQDECCKILLGGNVKRYRKNIARLFNSKKHVWFRMPVIKPYTYNTENIRLVLDLLKQYKPDRMEIFKVHRLAKKKYEMLNKPMLEFEDITDMELEELKKDISDVGVNIEIISL